MSQLQLLMLGARYVAPSAAEWLTAVAGAGTGVLIGKEVFPLIHSNSQDDPPSDGQSAWLNPMSDVQPLSATLPGAPGGLPKLFPPPPYVNLGRPGGQKVAMLPVSKVTRLPPMDLVTKGVDLSRRASEPFGGTVYVPTRTYAMAQEGGDPVGNQPGTPASGGARPEQVRLVEALANNDQAAFIAAIKAMSLDVMADVFRETLPDDAQRAKYLADLQQSEDDSQRWERYIRSAVAIFFDQYNAGQGWVELNQQDGYINLYLGGGTHRLHIEAQNGSLTIEPVHRNYTVDRVWQEHGYSSSPMPIPTRATPLPGVAEQPRPAPASEAPQPAQAVEQTSGWRRWLMPWRRDAS